jgi:hypothetical protein
MPCAQFVLAFLRLKRLLAQQDHGAVKGPSRASAFWKAFTDGNVIEGIAPRGNDQGGTGLCRKVGPTRTSTLLHLVTSQVLRC